MYTSPIILVDIRQFFLLNEWMTVYLVNKLLVWMSSIILFGRLKYFSFKCLGGVLKIWLKDFLQGYWNCFLSTYLFCLFIVIKYLHRVVTICSWKGYTCFFLLFFRLHSWPRLRLMSWLLYSPHRFVFSIILAIRS